MYYPIKLRTHKRKSKKNIKFLRKLKFHIKERKRGKGEKKEKKEKKE